MPDILHVAGIRAFGHLGVLPEERSLGQWFNVDLSLTLDLATAGKSDRLEDTYDYSKVVQSVVEWIENTDVKLIESVAETIAAIVLESEKVQQVRVQVTKLTPPIPQFSGNVQVDITRTSEGIN